MSTYHGLEISKRNGDFGCSIFQLYKGELIIGIGSTEERAYEDLQTKIIIKESEKKNDVIGK